MISYERYTSEGERASIIDAKTLLGWSLVGDRTNQDTTTDLIFEFLQKDIDRLFIIERLEQPEPTEKTVACTLSVANLLTKLIVGTHAEGSTQAYTLPSGTLCEEGLGFDINSSFNWSLINMSAASADTITITEGVGHTIVGYPVVRSSFFEYGVQNTALLRTRKIDTNVFITYRIG